MREGSLEPFPISNFLQSAYISSIRLAQMHQELRLRFEWEQHESHEITLVEEDAGGDTNQNEGTPLLPATEDSQPRYGYSYGKLRAMRSSGSNGDVSAITAVLAYHLVIITTGTWLPLRVSGRSKSKKDGSVQLLGVPV
ncbi:hypothetical protein OEA41_002279 [Lepraria neglecta]|uniref:Uncharacterized protein n=1 Tax=Lepraria neglecta TaxID=209136 RepID=A0AAD9ZEJ6_9LECA|nr:hypothetical protein OEA41_002279 [Lepraria neglecta]